MEYHATYWPFLKKNSILGHFVPKCWFFYALLVSNIIFVLIILNLLVKDYLLCFLAIFMSFSLQNNTWELLGPTLPPNTLYPIIWGEWYLYGPILSCYIFLALSLAKSNVFSHILENSFSADLGHFWKLPIFTTHIQNL